MYLQTGLLIWLEGGNRNRTPPPPSCFGGFRSTVANEFENANTSSKIDYVLYCYLQSESILDLVYVCKSIKNGM